MIQRIQSLYLALATALMSLLLKGPIIKLLGPGNEEYTLGLKGIMNYEGGIAGLLEKTIPLSVILVAVPVLFFLSIFLFKKRKIQLRITVLSTLLSLGSFLLMVYYIFYAGKKIEAELVFSIKMIFPLVAAIFGYMAFRGILKDELLIKSYDRIR